MESKQTYIVSILLDYYTNKATELKTKGKRSIFFEYGILRRVFNRGNGILSFACIKDNVLVINECLLTKSERLCIVDSLKIPFVFVEYGYPYYYNNSLCSLYNP